MGLFQRLSPVARWRSFGHAWRGVLFVVRSQPNAWIQAGATLGVCAAGWAERLSAGEWCWVVLAISGVWAAEAFNTAVEMLTDLVSPEFHPLAGKAKDAAAGAVLIAAIGAAVIGLLVFGPHLVALVRR